MSTLGKEIKQFHINQEEQLLIGYRGWYIKNSFNDKPKILLSLNNIQWDKGVPCEGDINKFEGQIQLGIYNYNNYNNYNYNNYNYNYYNYNYNDYNYYNYYYNNYNYYNYYYNNYYNYYVAGLCNIWGDIVEHEKGYRSTRGYPKALVLLADNQDKKFLDHFNKVIFETAREYGIDTISQAEYEKENHG